jgi:hypothetical protein
MLYCVLMACAGCSADLLFVLLQVIHCYAIDNVTSDTVRLLLVLFIAMRLVLRLAYAV